MQKSREDQVESYIDQKGIEKRRFEVIGYGERKNIERKEKKEGSEKKRRVEIKIQKIRGE